MAETADLVIDGLAAWRLTHLIVEDAFPPVAALREAISEKFGEDSSLTYLVTCVYCTGVWAAMGVRVARRVDSRRWGAVAKMLAVSAAAPLVEGVMMRLEDR